MIRVLNIKMNDSEEYFINADKYDSKYYEAINNAYAEKFIPLKPKADLVLSALSKYWHTD